MSEELEKVESHGGPHAGPSAKEYLRVGAILAVITAFEVWLSYAGLNFTVLVATLLVASLVKFLMVVGYFMHLKYDDRRYARFFVMGIAGAITLYAVVLLMFQVFS